MPAMLWQARHGTKRAARSECVVTVTLTKASVTVIIGAIQYMTSYVTPRVRHYSIQFFEKHCARNQTLYYKKASRIIELFHTTTL